MNVPDATPVGCVRESPPVASQPAAAVHKAQAAGCRLQVPADDNKALQPLEGTGRDAGMESVEDAGNGWWGGWREGWVRGGKSEWREE